MRMFNIHVGMVYVRYCILPNVVTELWLMNIASCGLWYDKLWLQTTSFISCYNLNVKLREICWLICNEDLILLNGLATRLMLEHVNVTVVWWWVCDVEQTMQLVCGEAHWWILILTGSPVLQETWANQERWSGSRDIRGLSELCTTCRQWWQLLEQALTYVSPTSQHFIHLSPEQRINS